MKIDIHHQVTYRYSRPVFLEPFTIRLRPRCDYAQQLDMFDLRIDPPPAGRNELVDAHGNVVTHAWFDGLTEALNLEVRGAVNTLLTNPFDYLLEPSAAQKLPFDYPDPTAAALSACLKRQTADQIVGQLTERALDCAQGRTQAFLDALLSDINEHCEKIERHDGPPWSPQVTWDQQAGACRDLALLFIEACREVGLAGRFVSGYHYVSPPPDQPQLHAWAEVYLPGAGWRGYDPSLGLVVQDQYIALAAGALPVEAAPTLGSYRGSGVDSVLDFRVELNGPSASPDARHAEPPDAV